MNTPPTLWARLATAGAMILTAASIAGCPTTGTDDPSIVDPDVGQSDTPVGVCTPGEVQACIVEGSTLAMICNASGTAFVERECTGAKGQITQCRNGGCMACTPREQACNGDFQVVMCNDDGTAFEPHDDCTNYPGKVCRTPGTCQTLCEENFKFKSSLGCDYWAVDLDNAFVPGGGGFYDAMNAQFAVVLAVPPESPLPAEVEIYYWENGEERLVPLDTQGQPLDTTPLQPGEVRVYKLGPRNVNGTVQAKLPYRIKASAPVMAYQFNPLENVDVFSNDASLLLPATLLGGEYYVMSREQTFDSLRSYFTIVATHLSKETKIAVDFTASTQGGFINPGSPDEGTIPAFSAGDSAVFTLQPYDVLNIETNGPGQDLTGTRIRADRSIVVFGGSEAANAPNHAACDGVDEVTGTGGYCRGNPAVSCDTMEDCVDAGSISCCADHLEQQLLPLAQWGSHYIATKSWPRGVERDVWRVMAAYDNTVVVIEPPIPGLEFPVLSAGEWFEFETARHFVIRSTRDDKPIKVGQFLPTQAATGAAVEDNAGDPAFLLSIPVEQYNDSAAFLVPDNFDGGSYVNIMAPANAAVMLDDAPLPHDMAEPVGVGAYVVYRTPVAAGAHVVTADQPVAALVYGYSKHVSFGYSAGLRLEPLRKEDLLQGDDPGEGL